MVLGHAKKLPGQTGHTAGRELLKKLYLEHTGEVLPQIATQERGKPYFVTGKWHFSISHTKNYVAVIVGKSVMGVDIEFKNDRIFRVTEKFMHQDELKTLSECTEKQKFALLCWCAKETVFKMIDESGVDFAEMNCKIGSDKIILSYKNADFILKYMDFTDFFVVFS